MNEVTVKAVKFVARVTVSTVGAYGAYRLLDNLDKEESPAFDAFAKWMAKAGLSTVAGLVTEQVFETSLKGWGLIGKAVVSAFIE